jgi:hypothetical protein
MSMNSPFYPRLSADNMGGGVQFEPKLLKHGELGATHRRPCPFLFLSRQKSRPGMLLSFEMPMK